MRAGRVVPTGVVAGRPGDRRLSRGDPRPNEPERSRGCTSEGDGPGEGQLSRSESPAAAGTRGLRGSQAVCPASCCADPIWLRWRNIWGLYGASLFDFLFSGPFEMPGDWMPRGVTSKAGVLSVLCKL